MRIFVTGDVHADIDYKKIKLWRKEIKGELTLEMLNMAGISGIITQTRATENFIVCTKT